MGQDVVLPGSGTVTADLDWVTVAGCQGGQALGVACWTAPVVRSGLLRSCVLVGQHELRGPDSGGLGGALVTGTWCAWRVV